MQFIDSFAIKIMNKKIILIRLLNFATLSAWLIASTVMAATALLWFGKDFRGYYAAARVVLSGGNPYDYHILAPVLLETTGFMGNNPYYYAPFFAWFVIPFAWLPFNTARSFWALFNLALWNFSLWQLSNLIKWPRIGWQRWLLYLLATFIFAWMTWRYEQTGIILFALIVGVLLALNKRQQVLAGIWLSLLLIKPNITLIPVIAVTFWLIRQRNWSPVVSMGILTVAFLAVASIVTPDLYQPFFEQDFGQGLFNKLDGPDQIVSNRVNTTLHDWLTMLQTSETTVFVLSILAFVIGLIFLAIVTWKTDSVYLVVVVALLVNFAISPYALQYDYPPLALVFFWNIALIQYGRKHYIKIAGAAITFFIASVPFWERPISDGYWIVIGLIGLTFINLHNADVAYIPPSFFGSTHVDLKIEGSKT